MLRFANKAFQLAPTARHNVTILRDTNTKAILLNAMQSLATDSNGQARSCASTKAMLLNASKALQLTPTTRHDPVQTQKGDAAQRKQSFATGSNGQAQYYDDE